MNLSPRAHDKITTAFVKGEPSMSAKLLEIGAVLERPPLFAAFGGAREPAAHPGLAAPLVRSALAAEARIMSEEPGDAPERERLLDEAFGAVRFQKSAERLRAGRAPAPGLSLKAVEAGRMIGALRLWRIYAGFGRPALLLGPLAVAERRRGEGIGAALVEASLRRAGNLGHGAIVLVGDAAYYSRFGFTRRLTEGLSFPGQVDASRLLGLELVAGALRGAHGHVFAD